MSVPNGRKEDLARRLQLAYSGELGAGIAYGGHAGSLKDPGQRAAVLRIGAEERAHRERLGDMLTGLGRSPDPSLERRNWLIGTAIACFCRVGGWFCPMYGAGQFERWNVVEYELAARSAIQAAEPSMAEPLLAMAEVEWDHAEFFRLRAKSHWLSRVLPVCAPAPPRAEIRASFERFLAEQAGKTAAPLAGETTVTP